MRRGPAVLLIIAIALSVWALHSYWTAGFVHVLFTGTPGQGPWLDRVREIVAGWGPLAPVIYTLAVVVEVIVAPIPGTLLYAPAGAIFGGFVGGSLSLVGNVVGAAICAVHRPDDWRTGPGQACRRIAARALPNTARAARDVAGPAASPQPPHDVRPGVVCRGSRRRAGVESRVGHALRSGPLVLPQAYFAERVFEVVPGTYLVLGGVALIIIAIGVLVVGRRNVRANNGRGHSTLTVPGDTQP